MEEQRRYDTQYYTGNGTNISFRNVGINLHDENREDHNLQILLNFLSFQLVSFIGLKQVCLLDKARNLQSQ
jgi:hypothetical protein